MNDNKNLIKPMTLMRDEFITNVISLCNNSGLPFFVVEDVLKDLIQKVHMAAQKQLEEDAKRYNEQLNNKE